MLSVTEDPTKYFGTSIFQAFEEMGKQDNKLPLP